MAAIAGSRLLQESFEIALEMYLFGSISENEQFKFITKKWSNHAWTMTFLFEKAVNLALLRRRRANALTHRSHSCLEMQEPLSNDFLSLA